jgi:hypothetical protein
MFNKFKKILASVGLVFVVALLGALGGQEKKWLRRFILPLIVTIYAYFLLQNWWVLTIFTMAGWLSIGYGLPSYLDNPNHPNYDEGSFLGRFFYKLFKGNEILANIFTRGTVATLISISMLSVLILKGTWLSFLLGSALIIGVWGAVSWRGFGETKVKLFGKEVTLLNVDLVVYGVTACGFVLIINGWVG